MQCTLKLNVYDEIWLFKHWLWIYKIEIKELFSGQLIGGLIFNKIDNVDNCYSYIIIRLHSLTVNLELSSNQCFVYWSINNVIDDLPAYKQDFDFRYALLKIKRSTCILRFQQETGKCQCICGFNFNAISGAWKSF